MMTRSFKILGADTIQKWLGTHNQEIIETVKRTYKSFKNGNTICPDSYFLKFPSSPENRIIALPASIQDEDKVSGIKWIASYPENVNNELDRASATITLNCGNTGYPIACLEGSLISASRTAASAILGATYLHPTKGHIKNLSIVGAGLIAKTIVSLFHSLDWKIEKLNIVDLSKGRAKHFEKKFSNHKTTVSTDISTIVESDMIVFTTSAINPYVDDMELFSMNPTILHMSLRDISPSIICKSQNFTDNTDHAVKANTSLHLAEQLIGNRLFISGDIVDLIDHSVEIDYRKPRIYSPFGMGILDIAVGYEIYKSASKADMISCDNFFPQPYTTPA
ncbi:2,3-diaminopropionate biosynthesis protein SbnB [Microbulbifer sp. JMSA004]|uniref:2,3-diaminopropionate biosynthesis protein SbnB n=1 Tax=unclassified Microbulbifer TaxID=2619833 RepID=UPI0024ACA4A2|nr:2,3-diaminopropionate biosynthesis protein SbnB [Microbulbifer sp. VAAF005]WHI45913.1 2,3-diaminopropionate biosynthesis protein SbnB [Microbulbifer sp. VAAF005]